MKLFIWSGVDQLFFLFFFATLKPLYLDNCFMKFIQVSVIISVFNESSSCSWTLLWWIHFRRNPYANKRSHWQNKYTISSLQKIYFSVSGKDGTCRHDSTTKLYFIFHLFVEQIPEKSILSWALYSHFIISSSL